MPWFSWLITNNVKLFPNGCECDQPMIGPLMEDIGLTRHAWMASTETDAKLFQETPKLFCTQSEHQHKHSSWDGKV